MNSKLISLALGIGVSVCLLLFLLKDINFTLLGAEIQQLNIIYLPLSLIVILLACLVRALRFKLLIPENSDFSTSQMFHVIAAWTLALWVIPLRGGELFRPWVLAKKEASTFSAALAGSLVERVFDVIAVLALLAICLPFMPEIPPIVEKGATALGIITALLVVFIVCCFVAEKPVRALLNATFSKLLGKDSNLKVKLLEMFEEFLLGLKCLNSLKNFSLCLLHTTLLWFCFVAMYQTFLLAMNIDAPLSLGAIVTVMIALAIAAPSAPGFVGTFQFGCVLALSTLYGLSEEKAIAFSVIAHFFQIIAGVALGLFGLKQLGLSFSSLIPKKSKSE